MDLLFHNTSPSPSSSSSSSSSPPPPPPSAAVTAAAEAVAAAAVDDASGSEGERSWLSCFLGDLITGVLTCIFAVVGSIVGAITGALIGLATESGLLRGAGIGAISGAVFCIEAVESSVAIWRSRGSGIWSILFVMDIILSLVSGRIVYEKVDPAVQSAVQSQMSAVDSPDAAFREIEDIFETGSLKGLPRDSVDRLPKMIITEDNGLDASDEAICCSVCLQDFQVGEMVKRLPECEHMFHLPCIDGWLIRHGSCPLCRRNL